MDKSLDNFPTNRPIPCRNRLLIFFIIFVTALCAGVLVYQWQSGTWDYYIVATLDCRQGRKVILSSDRYWEIGPNLYYQVLIDGHEVVPRTFLSSEISDLSDGVPYDIDNLQYTVVGGRDGNLIAVIPKELPYAPIVLHDFVTGESWPHLRGETNLSEAYRKRQALRQRLEGEHPEISSVAKINNQEYIRKVDILDVSDSLVGDADVVNLRGLSNLVTLRLNNTRISDAGLKYLPTLSNIRHLNLSETGITDAGIKHLHGMKGLVWVDLNNTHVTEEGLNEFRAQLPNTMLLEY